MAEFFEKKATEGRSTEIEWFLSPSGPFHFTMVKGDYEFLHELMDTDEFLALQSKGSLLLDDYHYYLYGTGDRAGIVGSTISSTRHERLRALAHCRARRGNRVERGAS